MPAPERLLADVALLREHGQAAEVVEDGTRYYVVLSGYELPEAYQPRRTDLMVIADYQYPASALDMFWTEPHVRCLTGAWPQNADQFEPHIGRTWQRWSWHYPGWNPSTHSLITHLEVYSDRLARGC
jgi:Prokaryotic E2 family E